MSNLTNDQIRLIRTRLIDYLKLNQNVSQRVVGKNIGYSPTAINQFIKDTYPTDVSEIALKIENYLDNTLLSDQLQTSGHLKFAMTEGAEKIFKTANFALTENKIGVITGIPGCGKTHAVQEYRRRKPTAILIEVNPLVTRRSLIADICTELKIPVFFYRGEKIIPVPGDELFKAIVKNLKGTKRLLIVDEGEHLTVSCLEVIRRIQDFTEIGMLLSGTEKLLHRLRGERHELKQLFSRVGYQEVINTLELSDIKAILNINYPEAIKFASTFLSLSKHNGRYLEHLITLVKKTIRETGEQLTDDLIDEAAGSLLT